MNAFGAKASNATPPEKGSFPLDRQGQVRRRSDVMDRRQGRPSEQRLCGDAFLR
jgi:hypothetical protein